MKNIYLASSFLFLSTASAFAQTSLADIASLPAPVQKMWFAPGESVEKKILLVIPRETIRPLVQLITGKVVQRVANTGKSIYYISDAAIKQDEELAEKAAYESADGILNPGGTLNDAISDTGSLVKSPMYGLAPLSKRVKICTSNLQSGIEQNLTVLDQIDPMEHMAVMIDHGIHETTDPESTHDLSEHLNDGGSIQCRPAPLMKNIPEPVAVQRLYCADANYQFDYHFIKNNCDGYTKDILSIAGYGFPDFANLGLGSETTRIGMSDIKQRINLTKQVCDSQIDHLKNLIMNLEKGQTITDKQIKDILTTSGLSLDAAAQLVISAARGGNADSRALVKTLVKPNDLGALSDEQAVSAYTAELTTMASGLSSENLSWIHQNLDWMPKSL